MQFCFRHACAILAALGIVGSASAADLANGRRVFESTCIACHGSPPVGGPETVQGNIQIIKNAMNNQPAMQFMRGMFTDTDLTDLAAYLLTFSSGPPPPPPPPPPPVTSYQGLWLKADEGGWGVNITHQGTTLFATWFTYDTDGSGMWLVASSVSQTSAGNFSGTLYRTVGPAFSATPFTSIGFPANYTQVGTLSFSFADANTGTMAYTVNGVSQSKAIQRFIFAAGGTNCTLGGSQGASPNYQDLWLRAADGATEAGWGINITHQGDILFATWFTYLAGSGSTNKGMWVVMSNGAKTSPGVYTGALQTTTGPAFSATPFNPNNVARTTVGTGTFTFSDANNGTFNYTVNGVTQSKPIARFIYATPSTVCQ
jgi:cytochrome c553